MTHPSASEASIEQLVAAVVALTKRVGWLERQLVVVSMPPELRGAAERELEALEAEDAIRRRTREGA